MLYVGKYADSNTLEYEMNKFEICFGLFFHMFMIVHNFIVLWTLTCQVFDTVEITDK